MTYLTENLPLIGLAAFVVSLIFSQLLRSGNTLQLRSNQPVYVLKIDPDQLSKKSQKQSTPAPNTGWGQLFLAVLFACIVLAGLAYYTQQPEELPERVIEVDSWEVEEYINRSTRP